MGISNFPHGISSFGIPVFGGGIPAGPGKVFHLVKSKASTDVYYSYLLENSIDDSMIYDSLSSVYDQMTSGQGDTLLVYPGNHIQTASLTWDKDDCRIIGMGSPNQLPGTTSPITGSVVLSTATTTVGSVLNITAHHLYMRGVQTMNNAAATTNYCDVMIGAGSRNLLFENCGFRGGSNTTQCQNATAGIPIWVANAATAGNGTKFVNCWIGSSGNTTRTKGPGCIYFAAGSAKGLNFEFENCRLSTRIETNNSDDVCMVHLAGNYASDRYLLFKDCLFYNFWENKGGLLDFAIKDANGTSHDTILMNCAMVGIDAWSNVPTHTWTNIANAESDGGKGIVVDETA